MGATLIVDDDPFIRDMLRRALAKRGVRVIEACNGNKAVELAREFQPSVVIVDMIMPEMDGLETIAAIREVGPKAVIVAMTGGGRVRNLDLLDIAKQIGADVVLPKPFDLKDFFTCLAGQFPSGQTESRSTR